MVKARGVVAQNLRGSMPDEQRSVVARGALDRVPLRAAFHRELKVLGRLSIGDRDRVIELTDDDRATIVRKAFPRDGALREGGHEGIELRLDGERELAAVRDQRRLGVRVMLGLSEEVGRDPCGACGGVGYYHNLGGAREKVDSDLAVHELLRLRDVLVAGPDYRVDARYRFGAVRHRRNGLGPADGKHPVDPAQGRGREDLVIRPGKTRIGRVRGRRGAKDHVAHARGLRGGACHDHARK